MFRNRADAGARLAAVLAERDWSDPVVFGLARGGLPVAAPVAEELDAPLELMVARKIGAPGRPELGLGAVAADGPPFFDRAGLRALGLTPEDIADQVDHARAEARDQVRRYLGERTPRSAAGHEAVVVDDGVATGGTAIAALRALRSSAPLRLVFAAPVGAPSAAEKLAREADEVVFLREPKQFHAVGEFYVDFSPTSDQEVLALLPS
ncbi:phosphoribosyltransferase [Amycolatopsis echigonensis]|uniref:Phosphoribosyltransferase n=1 Tax=Amycolatopsis echigonensis TaxID=2576905 RepID=A0A2N3WSA2_9PSEU|nr:MULTISPECIES: phosphoribosyltransferase family protein [Amycolatopsis]MBB2502449.1 phosphoribosyltransferase [Amycolatopsis echigonensis]PKV96754.1 putative phosphoribosyltransferase [Amycolatopsis niigatensis]